MCYLTENRGPVKGWFTRGYSSRS